MTYADTSTVSLPVYARVQLHTHPCTHNLQLAVCQSFIFGSCSAKIIRKVPAIIPFLFYMSPRDALETNQQSRNSLKRGSYIFVTRKYLHISAGAVFVMEQYCICRLLIWIIKYDFLSAHRVSNVTLGKYFTGLIPTIPYDNRRALYVTAHHFVHSPAWKLPIISSTRRCWALPIISSIHSVPV